MFHTQCVEKSSLVLQWHNFSVCVYAVGHWTLRLRRLPSNTNRQNLNRTVKNDETICGLLFHKPFHLVWTLAVFFPPPTQYSERRHTTTKKHCTQWCRRTLEEASSRVCTSTPARELPGKMLVRGNLTKSSSSVLKLAVNLL